MPKLTRYLQKIFANNSNQVGVFGTGVDKETSKNVETLQSADYENGWSSAIITNKNYPIWQEMDGVQYGLSYQLKYLFQNGIPEWISTETYYTNSYCRYGSDIYYSLQDDNTNHNPALNDGWWTPLLTSSRSIGEIVPSTVPLTEAGLHLLDGALISSGMYADFVTYISDIANMARTANTISNFSTTPSNAFDGNITTEATTGTSITIANNAYLGQSGLTKPVKTVRIYQGGNAVSYCSSYKLQYSNNGSTWIDIQTVSGVTQQWQTVAVNDYTPTGATHSFRILGVTFAGTQGANNWRVMELELYPTAFCGFSTEGEWQTAVTTYGVCGKFVYDSVNNTVRLPKYGNQIYTKDISSTTPVKGNGKVLGLTQGSTSNFGMQTWNGSTAFLVGSTALYDATVGAINSSTPTTTASTGTGVTTDGTKSGLIADLSDITQTLDCYYYIVVATSTKTDIEVDIDEIATDLNGKADVDLTNCTNQAFIQMAKASMPSNTKVAVTVGASGATYQAPADGWYEFITTNTATQTHYTYLVNETTTIGTYAMGVAGVVSRGYVPVKKNDYVSLGYFNNTIQSFYFVYAQGSESEAS